MVNPALVYSFGGAAGLFLLLAVALRSHRIALGLGAVALGGAAAAASTDSFWTMVSLGLIGLWCGFLATNLIDLSWRFRAGLVTSVGLLGFIVLWPTLNGMSGGKIPCPAFVKEHVASRLVAGLDLRGGLRLVYTVDVDEAIKDKRDRYYEDMRRELAKIFELHKGDEQPTEEVYAKLRKLVVVEAPRSPTNALSLVVQPGTDPTKVDTRFLTKFSGDLSFSRSADKRRVDFRIRDRVETEIRERAVSQAREIILRRVDELGLREAGVTTRDEDIIVEVPGEDEKSFATIRDIISQTARLEFKLLDDDTDYFRAIRERVEKNPELGPEGLEFRSENAPIGKTADGDTKTKEIVYAYLNMAKGEKATDTLKRFREWAATLEVPPDREIGFELDRRTVDPNSLKEEEAGFRTYLLRSHAEVTGDQIRDAQATPSQDQSSLGGWHVGLTFTEAGGTIFERITGANIKRRFAIILDGRIESSPVIQGRIPGGHAQITMGSADPEMQLRDSKKLELVLRSGALPAPISPSNEQRIGPSLGRDAIRLGVQGAVGGGVIVLVFMLLYYSRAGVIADLAVLMNLFLQLAVLASFGASMTLPGIAGLALTIGMSVDVNVLFNERIREELAAGKTARTAVEIGFSRAWSAILDGHVTTLISGVILAQYGTGPIKGFAVTLIVGVLCSLFTGVFVSRVLFDLWVRGFGRQTRLSMG